MEIWNMGSFSKNVPRAVLPLLLAFTGVACVGEPTEESRAGAAAQAVLPQCVDLDAGADAGTDAGATPFSNSGYDYGSLEGVSDPFYGYGYDGLGLATSGPFGYGVGGYGYGLGGYGYGLGGYGYQPSYPGGYGLYGGALEPNYGIVAPPDLGSPCQN
jgi:hypothetical protein